MFNGSAMEQRDTKLIDNERAGGEQRLARVEIVDHPRKEAENIVIGVAIPCQELPAGSWQDRRKALLKPVEHETQGVQLADVRPDDWLGGAQLPGEFGDIEKLLRGLRHPRCLQNAHLALPV
jgi:hypothetical protein